MEGIRLPEAALRRFAQGLFAHYGFSQEDSAVIADVLLTADLFGIQSHGVQRLMRYYKALEAGEVAVDARPEVVYETPVSATLDAHRAMGPLVGAQAMRRAIDKAGTCGVGLVAVRNSSHYGIAGYYTQMALKADLVGVCMTNTEAILVPTFGAQPVLGTNPIAFAMPADPIPFWFDAAMTVVPRGKLEVYAKDGAPLPPGWALDAAGRESRDGGAVVAGIEAGARGGILPLGGWGETQGGHKGYGLALMVDLCTAVMSGGLTSPHMKQADGEHTCHCFWAMDYGIFGDKAAQRQAASQLLQELRQSAKADGQPRIYTHGEKAWASRAEKRMKGIPVQEKTWEEIQVMAEALGLPLPQ